jgi:hypothetical protein
MRRGADWGRGTHARSTACTGGGEDLTVHFLRFPGSEQPLIKVGNARGELLRRQSDWLQRWPGGVPSLKVLGNTYSLRQVFFLAIQIVQTLPLAGSNISKTCHRYRAEQVRPGTLQGAIQTEARLQRERDVLLQMVGDVAASMGQAGRVASAARDLGLKAVPGAVKRWGFDQVMHTTLKQVGMLRTTHLHIWLMESGGGKGRHLHSKIGT